MNFQYKNINIRIHPLLPCIWGITMLFQYSSFLLPMLLAMFLHEAGHFCFCRLFRLRINSLEITPFGGIMQIEDWEKCRSTVRFLVAFGGPLFSFLGCLSCGLWIQHSTIDPVFFQNFTRHNILLFVVNLLPASPLDGGKMLSALLEKLFSPCAVQKVTFSLAILSSVFLCFASLQSAIHGELNFAPAFAGLYLLYAACMDRQKIPAHYISSLISRRQLLQNGSPLPVSFLAAGAGMTSGQLLGCLTGQQYHIIYVLSEDGLKILGEIDENTFCNSILCEENIPLADLMKKCGVS